MSYSGGAAAAWHTERESNSPHWDLESLSPPWIMPVQTSARQDRQRCTSARFMMRFALADA